MFYCQECASERGWPYEFYMPSSRGPCEICKKTATCVDVPSKNLPSPKKTKVTEDDVKHPGLLEWLAGGQRGVSANTIVQTITGIRCCDGCGTCHPLDPDDFRRCELLLREVPSLRPLLYKMSDVSEPWKNLVERWYEVLATMLEEHPTVFKGEEGRCSKAYDLMKEMGC